MFIYVYWIFIFFFTFFAEWWDFFGECLRFVFLDVRFPPWGPGVDGGTGGGAGGPPIFGTPGIEVAPEGFADGSDGSDPTEGIWLGYTVA